MWCHIGDVTLSRYALSWSAYLVTRFRKNFQNMPVNCPERADSKNVIEILKQKTMQCLKHVLSYNSVIFVTFAKVI